MPTRPSRREITDQVRTLIGQVRRELERLTYDPSTLKQGRGTSGTIIRTKAGTLIGQVADETAVAMIVDAPRWLRVLTGYVERMETEAYELRADRRRSRRIEQALYAAHEAGISTPTGQRHIELAIDRLYGHGEN